MAGAEFGQIFALHPRPTELSHDVLLRCVDECLACAASCTACADASLSEDDDMRAVVRFALDCADLCDTTRRIVLRQTAQDVRVIQAIVGACAIACRACADECETHAAHHQHCRLCAEACNRCEQACLQVAATTLR